MGKKVGTTIIVVLRIIEAVILLGFLAAVVAVSVFVLRRADSCGKAAGQMMEAIDGTREAYGELEEGWGEVKQSVGKAAYYSLEALDEALDEVQENLDEYQQNHGK